MKFVKRKSLAIGLGVLLLSAMLINSVHAAPRKKLIHLGWDQPTTGYLRDHWQKMDQAAPFDGITFEVRFNDGGQLYTEYAVMRSKRWNRNALQKPLEDLRSTRFTKLTNNFIRVNSPLAYLDWYDDAGWEAAIANVADIAWLAKQAKEAHVKGISFDTETYNAKQYQWRPDSGRSFEETAAQVRKRGAQMMKAVTAEYTDITIWALWLFSKTQASGQTQAQQPSEDYGLWPSFVNGWLDALPPQARLIDGMEDAYYFTRLQDYAQTYAALRSVNSPTISNLLAPEHRTKYQTQVSVSFGLYVDAFLNAPDAQTKIDRLRQNLAVALETSDDMVWLYNEQVKWWEIGGETLPDWGPNGKFTKASTPRPGKGLVAETVFPGIVESVNLARDPQTVSRQIVEQGKVPDSVINGSFAQGEGKKIPGWWDWLRTPSRGSIERDATVSREGTNGSLRFSALEGGALVQTVSVQPGQLYAVRGWVRQQGKGNHTLRVRWATDKGIWNNLDKDTIAIPEKPGAAGEWLPFFTTVQVPEGSQLMRILLGAANQPTAQDSVWYDDVSAFRIR
jgi:hypothetical protein